MALKGFKTISVVGCASASTMTLTKKYFKFSGDTARELGYPQYIKFLINDKTKQIAVVATSANDEEAIAFPCKKEGEKQFAINIAHRAAYAAVCNMMHWDDTSRRMKGVLVPEEKAIMYSMEQAIVLKKEIVE